MRRNEPLSVRLCIFIFLLFDSYCVLYRPVYKKWWWGFYFFQCNRLIVRHIIFRLRPSAPYSTTTTTIASLSTIRMMMKSRRLRLLLQWLQLLQLLFYLLQQSGMQSQAQHLHLLQHLQQLQFRSLMHQHSQKLSLIKRWQLLTTMRKMKTREKLSCWKNVSFSSAIFGCLQWSLTVTVDPSHHH